MNGSPTLDAAFVTRALGGRLRERRGGGAVFGRAIFDSREARAGDLFVALPGAHHDGHDFAAEAVARGAAGTIVERSQEALDETAQFVVVDALDALQALGAAWRDALPNLEVVGITGNVGKTTTKGIAAAVLRRRFAVQAREDNYNNEIGVPLCLLELKPQTERAVIEMGMYTTGEIALLCEWARPRIGVVLNVGPVHLERAGSLETIARAKRELVEALPADGHAVLNADDPVVEAMATHTAARVWRVGTGADADVRGSELASCGAEGFAFTLSALGEERRVRVPLPGAHLLSNVLTAAAVGLADGISLDEVTAALETLELQTRLRVRRLGGDVTLLDDTYNASPAATIAALDVLAEMPGRRLALLGDMLELGELSERLHREVGTRAAEVVDVLYTTGELARGIADAARASGLADVEHFGTKDAAVEALSKRLRGGDALLVKGSRALALETVVAAIARERGDTEDTP
jgi:UDP-N-acetylmuramoyl-tripeptide--D-alanyl-D-alanine ligase